VVDEVTKIANRARAIGFEMDLVSFVFEFAEEFAVELQRGFAPRDNDAPWTVESAELVQDLSGGQTLPTTKICVAKSTE